MIDISTNNYIYILYIYYILKDFFLSSIFCKNILTFFNFPIDKLPKV